MRTKRGFTVAVFALVVVFAIRNGKVSAHHSRAHYESDDKQKTLKGTVAEYKWRNPHVHGEFALLLNPCEFKGLVEQGGQDQEFPV